MLRGLCGRSVECVAFKGPVFPFITEFWISASLKHSTLLLIFSRPMTSLSCEAMNPMPLSRSQQVARSQRNQGKGQGSHEGHCLSQRRRKKQRHLIRPRTRRTLSLVKNVAGKMTSTVSALRGCYWEHSACLLIGSVSCQGSDIIRGSFRLGHAGLRIGSGGEGVGVVREAANLEDQVHSHTQGCPGWQAPYLCPSYPAAGCSTR